jgi:hypothetical protein
MRSVAIVAVLAGSAALIHPITAWGESRALAVPVPPTKAVVELYTSQACSSCPSADAVLSRLAQRNDIIAISWGVDYWDYLGWRDTAARPEFTERQKAYAKKLGDGMVYTPQAVINGLVHVNGSDEGKIERAIDRNFKMFATARVPVRLTAADGKLVAEIGAAPEGATVTEAAVWLAPIAASVEVQIVKGENRGKTLVYSNVARGLIPVGTWNGKPMTVRLDRHNVMYGDADRCALLLQQGRGGPIVGAAYLANC